MNTPQKGSESSYGWQLLQLADSAFPSGGFAHSSGLEAACQLGEVNGSDGLAAYIADSLDQCGHAALPFFSASLAEPTRFAEWDQWYDATLPNHVANRASRALGQGMLTTSVKAFGNDTLQALKATVRRDRLAGHLPIVTGAICAALAVTRMEGQRLFLFLHLRTLVSTAVRLGIVGPLEAQAIQFRMSTSIETVFLRCCSIGPEEACASAPLHDLFQGHHDRLYSRLFMS